MAYDSSIPAAANDPSADQPLMLANFQEIATALAENHGSFNAADQGKHTFLQFVEQSTAPTTAATEGALYTKDVSGAPELFWREESNGTEYQITNQAVKSTSGYMKFAGGLMLQWFSGTLSSSGATVSYPTAFSSATYNIQINANSTSPSVTFSSASATTTGFKMYASSTPVSYQVFVIGV